MSNSITSITKTNRFVNIYTLASVFQVSNYTYKSINKTIIIKSIPTAGTLECVITHYLVFVVQLKYLKLKIESNK